LQSHPAFDIPEKKAVELYSSHSPDALVTEETGVYRLMSDMVQMGQVPEQCQGVVGMTCLSLYLRAQALSRLLRNGARVEVRVLPGSICDLGVCAVTESADQAKRLGSGHLSKTSEDREGGGFAAFGGAVNGIYDRIHTTNVMDYVGALNLLLTVGSLLKVDAPPAAMKANIMLDFLKYLKIGPQPSFDLSRWIREELMLSGNPELADFMGFRAVPSPSDFGEFSHFEVVHNPLSKPAPITSPRMVEWIAQVLDFVTLPYTSVDRAKIETASAIPPKGHTIVTFIHLLGYLVHIGKVTPHWVAERVEGLLGRTSSPWHIEFVVAISMALRSLPFTPVSPALVPIDSLVQRSIQLPLLQGALQGRVTHQPNLGLIVVPCTGFDLRPSTLEMDALLALAGEGLRSRLIASTAEL
jgi:hypothetical protein